MNKKEVLNKIFNEIMFSKPRHHLTIVCCFNSRKDMQNFIQSLLGIFICIETKINLGTVSDCVSINVENNKVYIMHDNCKCTDGITPDLFLYQAGIYKSQIIDIFKFKSKYIKNSQVSSFDLGS